MIVAHHRLVNWGRWCRTGAACGRALSFEGRYRAPPEWYAPEPIRLCRPDDADAWEIETACRLLPLERHVLLKLLYVYRRSGPEILRMMRREFGRRLSLRDLDAAEMAAIGELGEKIELPAVIRMHRARRLARRVLQSAVESVSSAA